MGASQSQFESQPELHPQPQSQQVQQQSELHPEPQSRQLQPRPRRQLQPQSHEPTGREVRSKSRRETETLLLSPQAEYSRPSINSTRTGQNSTGLVKANENQSIISVRPRKELNFPHNYEHILKGADSPIDKSSREKLCDQLYAGVFLDHKTKVTST